MGVSEEDVGECDQAEDCINGVFSEGTICTRSLSLVFTLFVVIL